MITTHKSLSYCSHRSERRRFKKFFFPSQSNNNKISLIGFRSPDDGKGGTCYVSDMQNRGEERREDKST